MFDWAEKMIENMKEHGEIKTDNDNEGSENGIKLSEDDLQKVSQMVIQQLNNGNKDNDNENNESEDEQ